MPVPSLFDLAKTRLVQNIHMLEDIGDLPYAFLAPILRQITIPDQLVKLEANCPQIRGETGEIWLKFIKADIPGWEKKPHQPSDPKNWSKVYRMLKKEAEKEDDAQKEALRQKMQALNKNRQGHQTTILEGKVGVPRQRAGFALGARTGWGDPAAPKKTGRVAIDKIKRGMYDHNRARPKASMVPAHLLNDSRRTIKEVPARMVRMAEAEAQVPKRMVAPKAAPASTAGSSTMRRPTLRHEPMPRLSEAAPERAQRPERARLPSGQQFSAPRPAPRPPPPAPSGQPPKRARTEPSVLVQPKRRRV